MVGRGRAWLIGLAALATAIPAASPAQKMVSDSYNFIKAVRDRDGTKVQQAFDASTTGGIAQARDSNTGETALLIVTRRRDYPWLQFMLAKGVPVNVRDRDGMTALAAAAQVGWLEGVQLLLDVGAQVDLADDHGQTPLILATQQRDLGTVRALLAAGADPRKTDNAAGMSALDYAQRDPRATQVLALLKQVQPKPKRQVAGPQIGG